MAAQRDPPSVDGPVEVGLRSGNLALLCHFHHKLVHEYGWRVRRTPTGGLQWRRPSGVIFEGGLDPPTRLPLVS